MNWKNLILLVFTIYAIYYIALFVFEKMKLQSSEKEGNEQEVIVDIFSNSEEESPKKVSYVPDPDFDENQKVPIKKKG